MGSELDLARIETAKAQKEYKEKYWKIDATAKIYNDVTFRYPITLTMQKKTFIGTAAIILVPKLLMREGSQINAGAILFGREHVCLGRNSVISYGTIISTSSDSSQGEYMNDASPESKRVIKTEPVIIFDNVFIGAHCYIAPGVIIGQNSIIGAGTYLSKNIEANKVVIPKQELTIKDRETL
jgi:acetyltransferase-like isoleucine patch superfamily enzyme